MTPRRAVSVAMVLASASWACARSESSSTLPWDACTFLPGEAVQLETGGPPREAHLSGPADHPWTGGPAGQALSMCRYTPPGPDAGADAAVTLVARLSAQDGGGADPEAALLARQGFSATIVRQACGVAQTDVVWATVSDAGGEHGQVHLFADVAWRGRPLHATFVLHATGIRPEPLARLACEARAAVLKLLPPEPATGGDAAALDAAALAPADARLSGVALPALVARAYCEQVFRCCAPQARASNPFARRDVTACETQVAATLEVTYAGLRDSIAAKRASYDEKAALACADRLAAEACDPLTRAPADLPCLDAVMPLEPRGCTAAYECRAGTTCAFGDGGRTGACTPLLEVGAPCGSNESCRTGRCGPDHRCAEALPRTFCAGP